MIAPWDDPAGDVPAPQSFDAEWERWSMSMHKSLKVKNKHERRRNVLSREERIQKLQTEERWAEGRSVFGLPKVRARVVAPRKVKEKPKEAAAGEAPSAGAEAAQ
jgi:small basic protein (TIGR04137 family)